ncbi:MAG: membrane protein insertase YidC [Candidatus Dadabacteria bacterium]|nr:membrane protein insertase YidC [Candidatus Dadabacteria bacterium]
MNSDLKKNYILFLVLSVLVIVGYSAFFAEAPKEKQPAKIDQPASASAAPGKTSEETGSMQELPTEFEPIRSSYASKIIKVKSDLYTAEIDTLGGRVVGWNLAEYKKTIESDSVPVEVINEGKKSFNTILRVKNEKMPELIPFSYNGSTNLVVGPDGLNVNLVWKKPGGLAVRKTISFYPGKYFIKENLEILNGTQRQINQKVYVSWENTVYESGSNSLYEFISMVAGDVNRTKKPLKETKMFNGEINWFGFGDKYFLGAFLPEIGGDQGLYLQPLDAKGLAGAGFSYPQQRIAAGKSYKVGWKSYFGPKNEPDLREAGYNLEKSIDYGYAGVLTKIAVIALKFVNDFFSNFGISIIVLTVLLRVIFFPLTVKSMKSMKAVQNKMKKLKPEIDALKEKYKDDKSTQQAEMMKLYTSNNINPLSSLGGCLPLLIQLPVFIALYFALLYSIDLRHSSFLWVNDLSQPEHLFDVLGIPFRILPLLMGVSWFLSQRLTPMTAPGSETMELQMKLMQFMPIIFTVMFWGLPSGLILYWTVSNILSVGQQLYINRQVPEEGG